MSKKTFEEFTNQYELSKTLRFSLIPMLTSEQEATIIQEKNYKDKKEIRRQDKVEKFFQDNKKEFFQVDIERAKQYKKLKYYLTELHKLFIKDSLEKLKQEKEIDFLELFKVYKEYEKTNNRERKEELVKKINNGKSVLAKFFGDKSGKRGIFQKTAEEYYLYVKNGLEKDEKILDNKDEKQKKNNILLSQNVLLILDKKIKDESIKEKTKKDENGSEVQDEDYVLNFVNIEKKETNLIEYFKGWSTYFKNFNEIRGNLYKDDGRKEENEDTSKKSKIQKANAGQITTRILDENFEIFVRNVIWAEENIKKLEINDSAKINSSILKSDYYINCLLQNDINTYNEKIGELNSYFNEKKQNKDKDLKIIYLKTLYKQLILTDGLEDTFISEFVDDVDFIKGLKDFQKHSQEKLGLIKDFFAQENFEKNLNEVVFNENQTHFWCNEIFGSWNYFRKIYYEQNEVVRKNQSLEKQEFKDKEGAVKDVFSLSEVKDILNSVNKENFKQDISKGNFRGKNENEKLEYDEKLDNFGNFVLFLKYYFESFVHGRNLLTRREDKDLRNIKREKEKLEQAKRNGERVDELLLEKFSEENFTESIKESINKKEERFLEVLVKFEESIENKKELNRKNDFQFKKAINEYCDRVNDINRFFTLFVALEGLSEKGVNKTISNFKESNQIFSFYNQIRNFITKKKSEEEKVKLNFDVKNLMGGWGYKTEEHPKSSDYKCRLFRKNGKVYLGIVGEKINPILEQGYKIMDYYQLKGQTIFGSVYAGLFDGGNYTKDKENLDNCVLLGRIEKIIDEKLIPIFPKVKDKLLRIKEYKANGFFDFTITRNDIADDFRNIVGEEYDKYRKADKKDIVLRILKNQFNTFFDFDQEDGYLLNKVGEMFGKTPKRKSFTGVDKMVYEVTKLESYFYKIDFPSRQPESASSKILALFEIYSKDFSISRESGSKKNLHTLYFEELFSNENSENPIFKLSGGAELFFREKIGDHKKELQDTIKSPKTEKKPYKKRRFTENIILFHLPIVLNKINKGGDVNEKINSYIQENDDVKILGIDRGEKELAYYCLLDEKGQICGEIKSMNETGSNIIKNQEGQGKQQLVNYQEKLGIKEAERMIARKSWTKVEGIKDLKKGYISNVVRDIAKLMVENNAFVSLEELNYGFKKGRGSKIEKSIYQQLENALVDKLNYLVLEKSSEGVRNALQLTPENRAQKYWGNQMGAIFYTDAKFTSKTCPNCGFRKRGVSNFDTGENIREKIKNKDLKVFYEKIKKRFRIEYSWVYEFTKNNKKSEFNNQDLYGKEKTETVYSDMKRTFWDRKSYTSKLSDPNAELKKIFEDFYESAGKDENIATEKNHFSYPKFIQVFHNILNIRNTINGKDIISCPKCHFSTESEKTIKIKDGDANGAYNIARKGLMVFEKIRSDVLRKKAKTKGGIKSGDLKLSLNEWDKESFKQWNMKDWEESDNERGI